MKNSAKTLIYDDGCPLCQAYTSAFVATHLLDAAGRKNFSNVDAGIFALVDKSKCHNEIPLVDTNTKQVWYGIDALLELLDARFPLVKRIGNIKPIKWLLQKTYNFISYNRKVIVGSKPRNGYDCSPDFSERYRLAFLIFFLLINTMLLVPLHHSIFSNSILGGASLAQLQQAHALIVSINVLIAAFLGKKTGLEYLGQVNMLATTCLLLLLPLHFASVYLGAQAHDVYNAYLAVVAAVMLAEYTRRMDYAQVLHKFRGVVVINLACIAAFIIYLVN